MRSSNAVPAWEEVVRTRPKHFPRSSAKLGADPRQDIQGGDGDFNLGSLRQGNAVHTGPGGWMHVQGADTSPWHDNPPSSPYPTKPPPSYLWGEPSFLGQFAGANELAR